MSYIYYIPGTRFPEFTISSIYADLEYKNYIIFDNPGPRNSLLISLCGEGCALEYLKLNYKELKRVGTIRKTNFL